MVTLKLAYYRKTDWRRFVKMIDDRESMHPTWHQWHKDFEKAKRDLISQGFEVTEVIVDLDDLTAYCKLKGLKNIGSTRSNHVAEK